MYPLPYSLQDIELPGGGDQGWWYGAGEYKKQVIFYAVSTSGERYRYISKGRRRPPQWRCICGAWANVNGHATHDMSCVGRRRPEQYEHFIQAWAVVMVYVVKRATERAWRAFLTLMGRPDPEPSTWCEFGSLRKLLKGFSKPKLRVIKEKFLRSVEAVRAVNVKMMYDMTQEVIAFNKKTTEDQRKEESIRGALEQLDQLYASKLAVLRSRELEKEKTVAVFKVHYEEAQGELAQVQKMIEECKEEYKIEKNALASELFVIVGSSSQSGEEEFEEPVPGCSRG